MSRFLILPVGLAGAALAGLGLHAVPKEPMSIELGAYTTSLQGRSGSQRTNALLSANRLRNVTIPPHGEFSFNRLVGTWSKDGGYRKAPVSYDGQLVQSWGGGVCQTSTTVYNALLLAGLDVVERHRHEFSPSYVPPGRDAAVAFSNIDLRFRNPYAFPVRLKVAVRGDRVEAIVTASHRPVNLPSVQEKVDGVVAPAEYSLASEGQKRVRNSGKRGYEVTVWRSWPDRREMISRDYYPPLHRIVEYK